MRVTKKEDESAAAHLRSAIVKTSQPPATAIIRLLLATIYLQDRTLQVHVARCHVMILTHNIYALVNRMQHPTRKHLLRSRYHPRR